jgi:GTP-dependent phosphoenolpyruvate carboxykinase
VKFLEHTLKDWEWNSVNWWRKSEDGEFSIGLRQTSKGENLWILDIVEEKLRKMGSKETAADILKQYRTIMLPDKRYERDELEKAKADIDNMITRINNLKLFL